MTEREAIKELEQLKGFISDSGYGDDFQDKALSLAIKTLKKQIIAKHSKVLKWQKCTRKNGTEFLKLIYFSSQENGYIELGRFNMTKYEVQNNDWSLEEILKELE